MFNKLRMRFNPLLFLFESIFVDWWLFAIFSIMYVPMDRRFKKDAKDVLTVDTVAFCVGANKLNRDSRVYSKESLEAAIMHVEAASAKSSPLFFALISVCVLAYFPSLDDAPELSNVTMFFKLAIFVCLWSYVKCRFNIYKMRRIILDPA